MKILVPCKRVPDPDQKLRLNAEATDIDTGALTYILNPFDAIAVAAAGPSIPDVLVDQLRIGGRLVMPVGRRRGGQHLVRAVRTADGTEVETLLPVTFVPLTGAAGQ